jgi:DNA-binding phage protein
MATKTEPFDAADYLKTDEHIAAYMTEALATRDAAIIRRALDAIARARGISQFSLDDNAEFAAVLGIIEALGFRLTAEPAAKAA